MRHALIDAAVPVNSMHHQGIKALANGLSASAVAPDGLIEAAESTNESYIVGVQWHPEVFELSDPSSGVLFRDFVQAASRG
jgi:putative glutamine amidotransferase